MGTRILKAGSNKWKSVAGTLVLLASATTFAGCLLHPILHPFGLFGGKKAPAAPNVSEQPDKILYQRSLKEIDHGQYDVGRLTLQTLINTYPDSEYLSKAKLAIADSYYRQGGLAGLTQSEAEYADFITFFPTAPEAPMAQFRIAMAHFRLMGKPDRDLTQAREAQYEFKKFLRTYPDSPLVPEVQGRLRAVQEVLAEGEFGIAKFYLQENANPAARSRLKEIVDKYPNFSQADGALWDLTTVLTRMKQQKTAIPYYDRLIVAYPLSPYVARAKRKLAELHQPIPIPTLATLARARADQVDHPSHGLFSDFASFFSSAPNLSATRHGPVILGSLNDMGLEQLAKAKQPAPSATGSNVGTNSLAAKPVSDTAMKAGGSSDPGQEAKPKNEEKGSAANNSNSPSPKQQETRAREKKKGGILHFIRWIIPF